MAEISQATLQAFRSKRLHYVTIDSSNEDFKDFAPQVMGDAAVTALAAPSLLRPQGQQSIDKLIETMSKSLLAVAICLLPSEKAQFEVQEHGKLRQDDTHKVEELDKKPAIIGQLILGWGGISESQSQNRTASIGIAIATPYQNKGYGREAINWCLDWAFRHANLHTVSIGTHSFNGRAAHLYRDMGFVLDGRQRECVWRDRQWHDELCFSMTEGEWEALRGIVAVR